MIESWLYIFAVIAVLLIPGPTNAVLATTAHLHGFLKTCRLLPMVLLGYIYGISLWALLIHLTMSTWPHLIDVLHVVSAIYVIWLAFRMWKKTSLQQHGLKNRQLERGQLFKLTLKNPKSLLLAVGIFPVWTWDSVENYAWNIAILSICLIPCAMFWMYIGRLILAGDIGSGMADRLYKGSAMLLMLSMLPIVIQFF